MDIKIILSKYREEIDKGLTDFFNEHQIIAYDFDSTAIEAYEILRNFTLGPGKRLRPILMILGYQACGGRDDASIVKASCSLELLQSYLLIHDDVMDLSPLRRGKPTVHKIYEEIYQNKTSSPQHFGMSLSILVGNLANHLGLIAISEANFGSDYTSKALYEYNRVAVDVSLGQFLDMALPTRESVSYDDVAKVQHAKTSRYSTEGPLLIGALLGGGSADQLKSLEGFANPLGQAFQIKDDLLGMFGSEEKIGKSVLSDLKEGKKTLLILKALDLCDNAQRKTILLNLGREDATMADLEKVRRIVEETGAKKYSEDLLITLSQKSKSIISKAEIDDSVKQILLDLTDFLLEREN
jgi:geranylgeranyl diphosphate synthase, type I